MSIFHKPSKMYSDEFFFNNYSEIGLKSAAGTYKLHGRRLISTFSVEKIQIGIFSTNDQYQGGKL
jgi:hypothetical protein